jgi:hypothetical protein
VRFPPLFYNEFQALNLFLLQLHIRRRTIPPVPRVCVRGVFEEDEAEYNGRGVSDCHEGIAGAAAAAAAAAAA